MGEKHHVGVEDKSIDPEISRAYPDHEGSFVKKVMR